MADNWLKPYNFTAIQLPRRDLNPNDVLLRGNGSFDQKVGDVTMLFGADATPPPVSSGEPAGSIARSYEKKVELGIGARILGALFGAAPSSQLGANLEAKHASALSITYEDVTQDTVAVLALQGWLENARVETSRQAMQWLNDEKLAAVTAILRTAKLSIVAQKQDGGAIKLNVPEIEGIVGGQITVAADQQSSDKLTFTGQAPIAFGFQAFVMNFEGNVSFGLEQLRDATAAADPASLAWSGEQELVAVDDRQLPTD
jgi:hypothetical protein